MSLYLGNTLISGIGRNTESNANNLLDFKWSDHILNNIEWLRADTFSWHNGSVYEVAYQHLASDLSNATSATETIGSYTINYYLAEDGHKIILPDMETTVQNIYNESGVAWYYILDTDNQRFKLPRTKYGFTGLRDAVGNYVQESLPNITGHIGVDDGITGSLDGCFAVGGNFSYDATSGGSGGGKYAEFSASRSSSAYKDDAPVQQRATQMYLYFYVGNYTQSAVEQTAGLNAELFNGKADVDLSNCTKPHIVETYVNGTSWCRVYSDGWCEQGGRISGSSQNIYFLKPYRDTSYSVVAQEGYKNGINWNGNPITIAQTLLTTNYFTVSTYGDYTNITAMWQACGYIR